jgi:hypothetical protein
LAGDKLYEAFERIQEITGAAQPHEVVEILKQRKATQVELEKSLKVRNMPPCHLRVQRFVECHFTLPIFQDVNQKIQLLQQEKETKLQRLRSYQSRVIVNSNREMYNKVEPCVHASLVFACPAV